MANGDIHVELSALAGDARAWACVGDSHRRLRHAVEDLSLSIEVFHPEAEGRFEAHSAFADLVGQLQVQLGPAERASMSGAEALNDIRKRLRMTVTTSRPFTYSSAPFRRSFDYVRVVRRCPFSVASHVVYLAPATLAALGHLITYAGGVLEPVRDRPLWASAPEPWTLLAFVAFFFAFQVIVFRAMSRARKPVSVWTVVLAVFIPMLAMMSVVTLLSFGSHPLTDAIGVVVVMYGGWWAAPAWQWPKVREFALADSATSKSGGKNGEPAA